MKTKWIPLQSGEPIGVVALSGPVDPSKLDRGLDVLRGWGHPVIEAPNVRREASYLAGDDIERVNGLREVMAGGARLLIATRGGYGFSRVLDDLPWDDLVQRSAMFVGFSDVTAVLNSLAARGAVQIHGPMVASGLTTPANASRLLSLLRGELVNDVLFRIPERSVVRPGQARGPAMGGNLCLLCALIGTPWEPVLDGSVVFIEEVGEPLYRLDRMLTHLRGSGRLHNVKALIGGSLRGCKPAPERSEAWRKLLVEVAPAEVPVVVDLPFGHGAANLAFPIGATVELDTDALRVVWTD